MRNVIRIFALFCTVIFAIVGLIFFFIPEGTLSFFNTLSRMLSIREMPVTYPEFYLIVSVAYMYVVTIISYIIYRDPGNPLPLFLLANAKIASSVLSLVLVIMNGFYLICFVNFIVDGLIGMVSFYFYRRVRT